MTEGTAAVFTLSRSGTESLKLAITVSVTVSESEDMVASASEGSKTVSFSVGSASASHSVATVDDTAHEADSEVTLTVAGGSQYEVSSSDGSAKVTVTDNDNAAATGAPTISGNPWVGQTLSAVNDDVADLDGLSNATFTYQWKADGTDISGATQSEYVLQEAEQGNLITVTVSFTDDYGHDEIVTSGSVGPVIDVPGAPTLGRGEKGDSGVILRWTAPTETGGSPITGYEYEVNDDGSWVPTGSTGTTYQTSLSTFGSYTFHVRAVNAAGVGPASELFGYQSTQAVPTGAPTGLATDPGNGQVTLTWTGPDDNGGTPITHYELRDRRLRQLGIHRQRGYHLHCNQPHQRHAVQLPGPSGERCGRGPGVRPRPGHAGHGPRRSHGAERNCGQRAGDTDLDPDYREVSSKSV